MSELGSLLPQALSDDDLEQVVGGITNDEYNALKERLDHIMKTSSFSVFSDIVSDQYAAEGKQGPQFLERIMADYSANNYLTTPRMSELFAKCIQKATPTT